MIGVDPRVSGTQRYSVHVERPGMLHAAFVRSPHAHARVLAVDASGLPERLRGAPARGRRRPRRATAARRATSACSPTSRATRATSSPRSRRRPPRPRAPPRAAVDVSYEELPAVFDAVEAVAPGAPLLHPDAAESAGEAVSIGVRPLAGTNVCHRFRIRHGDAAAGFADADVS